MPFASRVAIALVALLLFAWSAVLWRDERIGGAASERILRNPGMSDAEVAQALEDLRSADLLDPTTDWELARAGALLLRGDRREAVRLTENVLDREPDNLQAWVVLREASEGQDPARLAQANAEILRLNPPLR